MMYGIIYKATNLINKKVYIGQTTRTLEQRRKEHEKPSKHNYLFQRAIRKYGKEAFSWQVIDKADDEVALNEKEVAWIAHYRSYKENGYNMTIGGDGVITFREIAMFDVDNSFIGLFKIAELTQSGFEPSRVYRVCKGEAFTTGGKKFLYADEFKTQEEQQSVLSQRQERVDIWKAGKEREVAQYTMEGELVKKHPSVIKAGKANDVSRKNVLDCIRGKQTNVQGFIYLYSDAYSTPRELKSEIQLRNEKKGNRYPSGVYQFNKQGQFLNHYSSTKEASLATNIPSKSIQKSCNKECLSSKGFVFLYKDNHPSIQEAQNEVFLRMKLVPVQQEVA